MIDELVLLKVTNSKAILINTIVKMNLLIYTF